MRISLVILFCISFTYHLYARCITDLYSLGLSADSFSYNIENKNKDTVTLASDIGMGFKIGNIRFCPDQKREYYFYYQMRYFSFQEAKKESTLKELESNIILHSFGLNTRFIQSVKKEYLIDIETRQDYATQSEESSILLKNKKYINLKTAFGLRYFIYSNKNEDFTLSGKLGPIFPFENSEAQIGYLLETNFEYFKRISRNYSIRADTYISYYQQKIGEFNFSRTEVGLRGNYIFRF